MPFKRLKAVILTAFVLLFVSIQETKAQFIRFNLNILPTFELKERTESATIFEPLEGMANLFGERKGIRWIEIKTIENTELLIEIEPTFRVGGGLSRVYFLNDGTADFPNSELLPKRVNSVRVSQMNKVLSDMPGDPLSISAWLGISAQYSGIIRISYP